MREARIRVVVHHRLALARDALATALRVLPDVDVIRAVPSLADATMVCRQEHPDVVVVDLGDDRGTSFASIADLSAACTDTRIICIVGAIDAIGISEAERMGVDHVVSTSVAFDSLIEAIRERQPLSVRHFVHVTSPSDGRNVVALTQREHEVLERLAAGESRTTMADALGISAKTVDNHKRNLVVKLGATNPAHAVSIALRRGLLRSEPDT